MSNRVCDLCGGPNYELICTRDRRGKPLHTAACTGCGLVGHETVPTEQELADYYARHYRQEYHGEATPSARRVWRAWKKGQRVVKDLAPYLKPGDTVFEVGAGIGCNVKSLELAGFEASGLEPGTGFQQFSAQQLRARIHHCSLFDFRPPTQYDLVLLIHVIEHFHSPRQALEVIHRLLRPGGRLYLECPSLAVRHTDRAEMFHFAHIHTFTPLTLLQLLKQCGFEPVVCFSDGLGCNHKFLLRRVERPSPPQGRGEKLPVGGPLIPDPSPPQGVAGAESAKPRGRVEIMPGGHVIDPDGYVQTMDLLRQYKQPWRRFSLDYFRRRMRRIRQYVQEFLFGKAALTQILKQCQAEKRLRQSA